MRRVGALCSDIISAAMAKLLLLCGVVGEDGVSSACGGGCFAVFLPQRIRQKCGDVLTQLEPKGWGSVAKAFCWTHVWRRSAQTIESTLLGSPAGSTKDRVAPAQRARTDGGARKYMTNIEGSAAPDHDTHL